MRTGTEGARSRRARRGVTGSGSKVAGLGHGAAAEGSEVPEEQGDDDEVETDGELVARRPAPIDLPSSFAFTVSPADMKRFVGSKNSRSLVGGWSAVYLSCALSFSYNHVRRQQSRKVHSPFWLGRAQCRTGNCIRRVDPGRASCRRRPREICRCWTF